jgi:4'-phosphopantetheinyl transferase EntD
VGPDAPRAAPLTDLAAQLSARGARLVWRAISAGDEAAFPDPSEPLLRRRASGAARLAAREALAALGGDAKAPLPRTPGRYPLWPQGFVGSLAHDERLAVALVAPAARFAAVGVDVEPAEPLPEDVAEIALSPAERRAADPVLARAIFAAKEAVYKAINPLDGTPLEYEDIEVDLAARRARLSDGRALALVFSRGERWIVAAWTL